MTKPITAVLFDLDGTLIDTHDLILTSMRYTMRTILNKEFPDKQLMQKVGQPLAVQMRDFCDGDEAIYEALLETYREYNDVIHDEKAKPFDGTHEMLTSLRDAGYALGVVTSKRHEPAMRGLTLFGLDTFMQCVIGNDDYPLHKPDPGPILFAAETLQVDPRACLYVGDSPYDIQAGNAAEVTTVAALWGMFAKKILLAQKPAYVCAHISELTKVLAKL
ncbi:MAG: HAD-IA family hydrolase [Eggerthellaceae bacterium]|nr:HAD-IA family hydrolase [Eggerthellaceae bacterium]